MDRSLCACGFVAGLWILVFGALSNATGAQGKTASVATGP
jgi:hypothetical protein